jgi:hypothetical protein
MWQAAKEDVVLDASTDLGEGGLLLSAVPYILHETSGYITAGHTNWGSGDNASPANITIDGSDRVIDLTGTNANQAPLITVGAGVTLTLKNITFKGLKSTGNGGDDTADNTAPIILVQDGTLILDNGAVLRDNSNGPDHGGGVRVQANGDLIMKKDSVIRNNHADLHGGGIYIKCNSGHGLIMNGGTISENVSDFNGGGVIVMSGEFAMSGGFIRGNTAAAWIYTLVTPSLL